MNLIQWVFYKKKKKISRKRCQLKKEKETYYKILVFSTRVFEIS